MVVPLASTQWAVGRADLLVALVARGARGVLVDLHSIMVLLKGGVDSILNGSRIKALILIKLIQFK